MNPSRRNLIKWMSLVPGVAMAGGMSAAAFAQTSTAEKRGGKNSEVADVELSRADAAKRSTVETGFVRVTCKEGSKAEASRQSSSAT